jgi:predicted transcriptional regulator
MTEKKTRGRKETFSSEEKLVATLEGLVSNQDFKITRYLMLQLVDMGYVNVEDQKKPTRGRPAKLYSISDKGMAFLTSKKV